MTDFKIEDVSVTSGASLAPGGLVGQAANVTGFVGQQGVAVMVVAAGAVRDAAGRAWPGGRGIIVPSQSI